MKEPWFVEDVDFDTGKLEVDIYVGFRAGAQLPCPEFGGLCPVHDTAKRTWRHLIVSGLEAQGGDPRIGRRFRSILTLRAYPWRSECTPGWGILTGSKPILFKYNAIFYAIGRRR